MGSFGAAVGSLPLCRVVVPFFYDKHAVDGWCIGPECFQGALFAASFSCALAAIFALYLDCTVQQLMRYQAITPPPPVPAVARDEVTPPDVLGSAHLTARRS